MRSIDWTDNVVGPPSMWSGSLLATVGMLLHSRHPMFLWWGADLIQFYNDAYLPSFGVGRHPQAMGQRGEDCWKEIWPIIWPQIDAVMRDGEASWNEDALVPIYRNGRIEEVYWTYGYSPVFDDDGSVGGTLVVCTETTARVLVQRRARFVRRLADRASGCTELTELAAIAREVVREAGSIDLPFVVSYCPGGHLDPADWRLTGSAHLDDANLALAQAALREHVRRAGPELPSQSSFSLQVVAEDAPWPEPVVSAVLIHPKVAGLESFAFGVSPRLALDPAFHEFFIQIMEQLELVAARLEGFRVRAAVESERRNLLLQAPVATALLTGPRHVFELANPLYRRIVGGRDVVGKAYLEAFPELVGTPLGGVLDRVYQTGEPFVSGEYRIALDRSGNGTLEDCYYTFSLEPLREPGGAVYGMMAVAVDLTEQVNARHALEKTSGKHEKLLLELAAANQAKDEFLATVSHELRTPLTSILGWSRLLSGSTDPARISQGLAVIERNAKAQAQLIEDILDLSRIIAGKLRINLRQVDPAAIVNAAIETVRPAATSKQVQLIVELEDGLSPLVCDEDRIQQVVWNLLSNAVKFTPARGQVVVRAEQRDARLIVSVRDTGQGISPAFLPHVFDRFRQDDASTTKQHSGLGLGLSIVEHLVELHGGRVSAESDGLGRGALFAVELPSAGPVGSELGGARAPVSYASVHAGQRLRGVHVLVVEDQEDARQMLSAVLERSGAQVTQAGSVPEAMRVLDAGAPHVIVSDIAMPGEDGYSFIQRARPRGVAALALTAYARPEDRQKALDAGFREHATKPIDPEQLIDIVARLALP